MSRKRKQLHKARSAPTERVRELMRLGWSRKDADRLCVIEYALELALHLPPEGRRVLADHVSTALCWQSVRCGVLILYGGPEHAEGWRVLSASAEPPFNQFMAVMARQLPEPLDAADEEVEHGGHASKAS